MKKMKKKKSRLIVKKKFQFITTVATITDNS